MEFSSKLWSHLKSADSFTFIIHVTQTRWMMKEMGRITAGLSANSTLNPEKSLAFSIPADLVRMPARFDVKTDPNEH